MSTELATILAGVIGGICVIVATVFSAFLAGIKDIKNRQFETIPPKDRYETFSALAELSGRNCEWSRHRIKALYERMGMYFLPAVNEKILLYVREMQIRYDDWELSAFLKCAGLMKSENRPFDWPERKYKKDRRNRCFALILISFVLGCLSILTYAEAVRSIGLKSYILYSYSGVLVLFFLFFIFIVKFDASRQKRARQFYEKFIPWFETKTAEENTEQIDQGMIEVYVPFSDRLSSRLMSLPLLKRWQSKKWKT